MTVVIVAPEGKRSRVSVIRTQASVVGASVSRDSAARVCTSTGTPSRPTVATKFTAPRASGWASTSGAKQSAKRARALSTTAEISAARAGEAVDEGRTSGSAEFGSDPPHAARTMHPASKGRESAISGNA